MHFVLYVCLPRSEARTSLQARKRVCQYLHREGFDLELRFAGRCDYFSVGGRSSGRLTLLRLRHSQPRKFASFWKQYEADSMTEARAKRLFNQAFPDFQGTLPVCREDIDFHGESDDAQVMDEVLFQQLQKGFSEEVNYSYEIGKPNVIFTEGTDYDEFPETAAEAAEFWVVVVDYHA